MPTHLTPERNLNGFMGILWGASYSPGCFIMLEDDIRMALIMAASRFSPNMMAVSDSIFFMVASLLGDRNMGLVLTVQMEDG